MLKKIFQNFISSLGAFTLVILIANLFVPDGWIPMKFLYVGGILALIAAIWWGVFFYVKLSYRQLWLCRSILILIVSITICTLMLFWNIIEINTVQKRIVFFLGTLIGNFVATSIIYIVCDIHYKRTLKKINETLKNNQEE